MRFRDRSDKGTASNFVQILERVQHGPWKCLYRRTGKKAWAVHGKPRVTEPKKGDRWRTNSRACFFFFWNQGDCSQTKQSIPHFSSTFYGDCLEYAKTSTRTLATKSDCCITTIHPFTLHFHQGIFYRRQHDCHLRPSYFSISLMENKIEWPPFSPNWGDWGIIADGAELPHRTLLSGFILKLTDELGTVNTCGKGLLRRKCWLVGPKLILTRWRHRARKWWSKIRKATRETWTSHEDASKIKFLRQILMSEWPKWKTLEYFNLRTNAVLQF
jgi:hypothetical protein